MNVICEAVSFAKVLPVMFKILYYKTVPEDTNPKQTTFSVIAKISVLHGFSDSIDAMASINLFKT